MTERERGPAPDDLVQSVSRALRVLEAVAVSDRPMPVKAVARRCGLNLSTTYHLIRTLSYEGYLDRLPDGTYATGSEVARRFHDRVAALGRPPGSQAVLRQLSLETGCSAYLGRFVGGQVVITDLCEGPRSPHLEDLEVGLDVSAHATAVGKALLSTLGSADQRRYLAQQGLRAFTPLTPVDIDAVLAELSQVRPGDPVVERSQFREGVACAAALVHRAEPEDPWWSVVVSLRADAPAVGAGLRPGSLRDRLLAAAAELASA